MKYIRLIGIICATFMSVDGFAQDILTPPRKRVPQRSSQNAKPVDNQNDAKSEQDKKISSIIYHISKLPSKQNPSTPTVQSMRMDIFFFAHDSVRIPAVEIKKIDKLAKFLTENPKAIVNITGYSDAGSGNNNIADGIATQRALTVVKVIKEQYGIAENRITYDSKGARIQPFAENDKNNVAICIAEICQ